MQEKTISKIQLKINEKYPIDKDYQLGEEFTVLLKGVVSERKIKDNMDGSVDVIITFWASDYEVIIK